MITECPICGTWEGRTDGDGAPVVSAWCAECQEQANCTECQGETMDERTPPGMDFEPPFDPEYEAEIVPDLDGEDD